MLDSPLGRASNLRYAVTKNTIPGYHNRDTTIGRSY